jgi:hypothetical protein
VNRACAIGPRPLVCDWFQDLFHSPPGVLFSFRSRYSCTIGLSGVFRLGAWSPRIHAQFLEPCVTQDTAQPALLRIRAYHPLQGTFPGASARAAGLKRGPTTPESKPSGLASSVFARRYWRNLIRFLFLRVLRCFNSPGWLPLRDNTGSLCWVAPFGHPGVVASVQLALAFRSLARPSSPLRA